MSYPDTIARLESQVARLQDARMQEARERDRLRSERDAMVKALKIFLGEDNHFQVAVGGNPNAVDKMLAEVRALVGEPTK